MKRFWVTVRSFRSPYLNPLAIVSLVVVCVYAAVAVYKAVVLPATEWDSLAYGVNYARVIFDRGNIPLIAGPSIGIEMSASYPPGVQLTAVYLYFFAGNANDFYFRILSPIFGLATLVTAYKFATLANRNRTASVFAIFALTAFPFFWELFMQATYLMGLAFMITLAAFFFYKAYHSKTGHVKQYEIIGSLLCCFSALTSYIGVFSFGLLLLYVIKARVNLKRFASLIALVLVIILPWYARNLVLLGNPFYPFFGIGKYLHSDLIRSTMQSFQNYASSISLYGWISAGCKLLAGLLVFAITYLTFSKRKSFLAISTLYLLLVGALLMALHIPFPRYMIVALPCFAVLLSTLIQKLRSMNNITRVVTIPVIAVFVISSVVILPYMCAFKPGATSDDDKWSYLYRVFEEADAWKWINENTPTDARIATFDIKEYYLNRSVLLLDGRESASLYKEGITIEEGMAFLREKRITYILDVPWTRPPDARSPDAYRWCVFTRYLNDTRYFSLVYSETGPWPEPTFVYLVITE